MINGCSMHDRGHLDYLGESYLLHGLAEGIIRSLPVVNVEVSTHYCLWAVYQRKDIFNELSEVLPECLIWRTVDNQDVSRLEGKF